jgi:hypothetical protein
MMGSTPMNSIKLSDFRLLFHRCFGCGFVVPRTYTGAVFWVFGFYEDSDASKALGWAEPDVTEALCVLLRSGAAERGTDLTPTHLLP